MMLRIAESPSWDTENEGKTLTPYWAADLLGLPVMVLVNMARGVLCATDKGVNLRRLGINGYTFEILGSVGENDGR